MPSSSTDPDIRLLTAADLEEAFGISSTAGWNQRLADWRMLLQLAPAGSFAAAADGRIVGTALGIDYGSFGWIAMMLVDPEYRGRGIGARLLELAMGALPPGNPIRLDATPLGRPLYQRYGFVDEELLTRHVAGKNRRDDVRSPALAARRVRGLTPADLPRVADSDQPIFGGNRRVVLDWALHGAAQYAHIIETEGQPSYCFGRPGRLFDQIGPVVASGDDDARALAGAALLAASGRAVVVDAFDAHTDFTSWLSSRGFAAQRPLFRMRRGAHAERQRDPRATLVEFAILGPEFA